MTDRPATPGQPDVPGTVEVVAAVVRDERGRLLIAQRPAHANHGGLWEFPGGKLDPGETLGAAVVRELEEELGLSATRVSSKILFAHRDPGQPFRITFVEVQVANVASVELREHDAVAWVGVPISADYRMAPTDAEFARSLAAGEISLAPLESP